MDFLYEHDKNVSDFEYPEITDMLEPPDLMFSNTSMNVEDPLMDMGPITEPETDWFNAIFEDQGLVYNDKNLGEAASQPCIKSEHSYSANNTGCSSPIEFANDPDNTFFAPTSNSHTLPVNFSSPSAIALDLTQKAQLIQAAATAAQPSFVKEEESDPLLTALGAVETATSTPHPSRPTTIILATTTSSHSSTVGDAYSSTLLSNQPGLFPSISTSTAATVHIKAEPMEGFDASSPHTVNSQSLIMPPTPPSSAGSDSDGSQSPQRSAPNSPQRQSPVRVYQYQPYHHHHAASDCAAQTLSQPLFLSSMPQSGVLILSEEEKRTLISEGYPIPSKLPLTKQEEKNLKKVHRKIKNKISAQESRRKKKEYLEALEKRVEAYNHENCDLKKKVESLENNNRSLMGQLHKLQALVAKVPRAASASATQTGTVLMVLVLCFAVFLGGSGFGPSSLNKVGYSNGVMSPAAPLSFPQPGVPRPQPDMGPGPARAADTSDDYTTPNLKSRVLMAFARDEPEDWCDYYRPLVTGSKDSASTKTEQTPSSPPDPSAENVMPLVTKQVSALNTKVSVVTVAVGSQSNGTHNRSQEMADYQATMHPDLAVAPALPSMANLTADFETA